MNRDEIIIRSGRRYREPMDFERLKFLCYFIAGMTAEILGMVILLVIVLAIAGVFK